MKAWTLVLLCLPLLSAQSWQVKRTPWGEPDFSGVWQQRFVDKNGRPVVGLDLADFTEIPYQPWSKMQYEFNKTGVGQASDPEAHCLPAGVPRSTGLPYPLRLMQSPGLIVMLLEGNVHTYRLILMDKEHPKDPNPTWMGHSTGKWDDDTLVVDSVGFKESEINGYRTTESLHVVERFKRPNLGTLEYEAVIEDPNVFTGPWLITRSFPLLPEHNRVDEFFCENNRDYKPLFGAK